ncbi:transposase domain-containing protein [Paraflavitalea speifideaquila]
MRFFRLLGDTQLNDVNPYEWLKDILSRNINSMPINKVKDLLPYNWKIKG